MTTARLFRGNPESQGYCLTGSQTHELRLALRFPVALCLALVVTGVALESPAILFVLVPIGLIAGFGRRHPFDLVWNGVVRHLIGGAELPPNPTPRRNAFKVAAAWLVVTASLFAVGSSVAGLVLGWMLVAACSSAALLNFCLPSATFAVLARVHGRPAVTV